MHAAARSKAASPTPPQPKAKARSSQAHSNRARCSPLDTPASTRALRLDDGRSPPPLRAQRLLPTSTWPHGRQARRTRCTLAPSTPPPAPARAASTMVKGPHHTTHSGSAPPARRTHSSSAHPDAHRPKPCNAGPRHGRAPTPLAQTPRPPQRTPPATARPGPAHAAAPAAACARPAPHSPAPKSMAHRCHAHVEVTAVLRSILSPKS